MKTEEIIKAYMDWLQTRSPFKRGYYSKSISEGIEAFLIDHPEYASQSPEPNTVTEPYHKEAIELVKKHIPNDALAKEYILESLQQTQAVVSKDDLRIVLALHGMTGTLAQECIKAINELLNQKK